MHIDNETLRRVERLHVRAWPATETARVDGWLWRWSGGGSQRANSASTIDFNGSDIGTAIDTIEARYREKGAASQFHTFSLTQPPALPSILTARGYGAGQTTITMIATSPEPSAPPPGVTVWTDPTPEWLHVYMEAVTPNRRAVNHQILRRIPDQRAFFAVHDDGRVISTALGVLDRGLAVAECVATQADARGRRGADRAMRALMTWAVSLGAHTIALQVVEDNAPALALYRRLGFQAAGANQFWVKR